MPVLCFVIDTSASMNQRTACGQRIIDQAKTAVENFISKVRSKDPSARTDQYLLITTSRDDGLRVGLKDTPTTFWHELRNIQANGLSNLGFAIQSAFDLLNVERHENELDSIGRGRQPWMIKPAAIIVITDGGKLTSLRSIKSEIELPGSTLPGANLINEPFRWDQRVFTLMLKYNATGETLDSTTPSQDNTNTDTLAALCDITGGRSFTVSSSSNLMETLQTIGAKVQSSAGVIINFEKLNEKNGVRPELGSNGLDAKPWHKTKGMVFVRTNYKTGTFQGFWPLPENYWPDPLDTNLPPRSAHPVLKFSTKEAKPLCLTNFAFDKLELEMSPLTVAMLERKRPDIAWQVFVEGSGYAGALGKPIGYLKPNSENKLVNLFLHPYDYEEALNLIDEIYRNSMNPSPQWKTAWEEYIKTVPNYYIPHIRKSLSAIRAPAGLIPDAYDIKLNITAQNQLKKIKAQLRTETEKVMEQVRLNRTNVHLEKMITVRQPESDPNFEFINFALLNKQRSNIKQPLLEPFDIGRDNILTQLNRMRVAFRQCISGGVPLHREHVLHEQPQGNMGNYQEYIKNSTQPLRDPDPDAVKMKLTFGNPWKRGRQASDSLDVDGFGFEGSEDRNVKQKRNSEEAPKKRRRTSSLSFREKKTRLGNVSSAGETESDWSDEPSNGGDSDWSDEASNGVSINPLIHIPSNGKTNGFNDTDTRENGYPTDDSDVSADGLVLNNYSPTFRILNGNGINIDSDNSYNPYQTKSYKFNYDEKLVQSCSKIIRAPGNKDKELAIELELLARLEEETVLLTIQKLQLEAIRFSRYSLLQILDGYISFRKDKINDLIPTEET